MAICFSEPKIKDVRQIVVPEVAAYWEDLAYEMDYDNSRVKEFSEDGGNVRERCHNLFKDWLETNNGCTPKTWQTLLEKIKKVEKLFAASERIEEKLKAEK